MKDLRMLGLRKNEDDNFLNFMELVQKKAESIKCKFYLDAGADNEKELKNLSLSDLYGWLIPDNKKSDFEDIFFNNDPIPEKYDKFYILEHWEQNGDKITINFV